MDVPDPRPPGGGPAPTTTRSSRQGDYLTSILNSVSRTTNFSSFSKILNLVDTLCTKIEEFSVNVNDCDSDVQTGFHRELLGAEWEMDRMLATKTSDLCQFSCRLDFDKWKGKIRTVQLRVTECYRLLKDGADRQKGMISQTRITTYIDYSIKVVQLNQIRVHEMLLQDNWANYATIEECSRHLTSTLVTLNTQFNRMVDLRAYLEQTLMVNRYEEVYDKLERDISSLTEHIVSYNGLNGDMRTLVREKDTLEPLLVEVNNLYTTISGLSDDVHREKRDAVALPGSVTQFEGEIHNFGQKYQAIQQIVPVELWSKLNVFSEVKGYRSTVEELHDYYISTRDAETANAETMRILTIDLSQVETKVNTITGDAQTQVTLLQTEAAELPHVIRIITSQASELLNLSLILDNLRNQGLSIGTSDPAFWQLLESTIEKLRVWRKIIGNVVDCLEVETLIKSTRPINYAEILRVRTTAFNLCDKGLLSRIHLSMISAPMTTLTDDQICAEIRLPYYETPLWPLVAPLLYTMKSRQFLDETVFINILQGCEIMQNSIVNRVILEEKFGKDSTVYKAFTEVVLAKDQLTIQKLVKRIFQAKLPFE